MKEYTVTYTVDVTEVLEQTDDETELIVTDERFISLLEDRMKAELGVDDLHVRDFKVFVRDVDSEESEE